MQPFDSLMMRVLLGPLLTVLRLFALYVIFHGHFSPGGGFQGGVLLGASVILEMLVCGRGKKSLGFSQRGVAILAAIGLFLFAGIGTASFLMGDTFLNYGALPLASEISSRRSLGILGVEIGVALTVMGVAVSLYHSLNPEEIL